MAKLELPPPSFEELRVRARSARVIAALERPSQDEFDVLADDQLNQMILSLVEQDRVKFDRWLRKVDYPAILYLAERGSISALTNAVEEHLRLDDQRYWGARLVEAVEYAHEERRGDDDSVENVLEVVEQLVAGRTEEGEKRPTGRDSGLALLQPVTVEEHNVIEPILSEIWEALKNDALTESQQFQIQKMGEFIAEQQRESKPGETPRWRLIGPVRASLKYLIKEAPKDTLAWWKLVDLLKEVGWTELAEVIVSSIPAG